MAERVCEYWCPMFSGYVCIYIPISQVLIVFTLRLSMISSRFILGRSGLTTLRPAAAPFHLARGEPQALHQPPILRGRCGGFPARHGGTPIAGWFMSWKIPIQKWMMTGGSPISGNLQMWQMWQMGLFGLLGQLVMSPNPPSVICWSHSFASG